MTNKRLCIKPSDILRPTKHGKSFFVKGEFDYFHYGCDGLNDVVSVNHVTNCQYRYINTCSCKLAISISQGWGCAYRTLQSMCSWIAKNHSGAVDVDKDALNSVDVPTIEEIQQTLVSINDKPPEFLHSTDWLGALEVSETLRCKVFLSINSYFDSQIFYVIDTLYDVPCRIQHIPCSQDIRKYCNIIKFYLENYGGLIMMGGDVDASSKGIAGMHIAGNDAYLLIVVSYFFLAKEFTHLCTELVMAYTMIIDSIMIRFM